MAKYKIVHLITSLKVGGAEAILCDLIRNSDVDLFENHVIYFYEGPNLKNLLDMNIPVYQIKGFFCKYDPLFIIRLFFLIQKIRPDCIHSSLWSANVVGNIIALILKIPIISVLHLATNFESIGKNRFFRSLIDKLVLKHSSKIVTVSDSMVKDICHNKWFSIDKLKVIKNGIDVKRIKQLAQTSKNKRSNYGIDENCFVIGSVGRFIPRKNHQMLIRSFAKLNEEYENVRLFLIGYGELEDYLKMLIKELKIENKVILIKSPAAYAFYPLFDTFVLTSHNESFGLVILEAMVFKLPCIVTNKNLDHEIIKDKYNGYLIEPNETFALYKNLKKLYIDKNERFKIGLNGNKTLNQNFTIERMYKKYETLFIETITNKNCFFE